MSTTLKSTLLLASIVLLGASLATPLAAAEQGRERAPAAKSRSSGASMQTVANTAQQGERGHGWQYFYDPRAPRAVVISPQGDYYFSAGKGLRWVAADQSVF